VNCYFITVGYCVCGVGRDRRDHKTYR